MIIKGKLSIIGTMEIEGKKLIGAFIECSKEELKKGRGLFCEDVTITASQQPDSADGCDEEKHKRKFAGGCLICSDCGKKTRN